MQISTPEISDALREAANRIVAEREKCLEIFRKPQGHGPGAKRAYSNRATGLTWALDIIKDVLQEEQKGIAEWHTHSEP